MGGFYIPNYGGFTMIYLRNYGRRFQSKTDEIAALKNQVGKKSNDGSTFKLIELRHKVGGGHPVKRSGYQDTDVTIGQDGSVEIFHRSAGRGALRFDPDDYMNRIAFLADVEHNDMMLVRSWRDRDWDFVDKDKEKEIEKKYREWWSELDKSEDGKRIKRSIITREGRKDLTPEHLPGAYEMKDKEKIQSTEVERLREENARLRQAMEKGGTPVPVEEETIPPEVIEKKLEEELKNAPVEEKQYDFDFDAMKIHEVRALAKKLNVDFDVDIDRDDLIKIIKEKL